MRFHLAIFGGLGVTEIALILMLGLLLFGARLPEVGRSLGRSLMEFKKGLRGVQDELDSAEREAQRLLDEQEHRERERERAKLADKPAEPTPEAEPHAPDERRGI